MKMRLLSWGMAMATLTGSSLRVLANVFFLILTSRVSLTKAEDVFEGQHPAFRETLLDELNQRLAVSVPDGSFPGQLCSLRRWALGFMIGTRPCRVVGHVVLDCTPGKIEQRCQILDALGFGLM